MSNTTSPIGQPNQPAQWGNQTSGNGVHSPAMVGRLVEANWNLLGAPREQFAVLLGNPAVRLTRGQLESLLKSSDDTEEKARLQEALNTNAPVWATPHDWTAAQHREWLHVLTQFYALAGQGVTQ